MKISKIEDFTNGWIVGNFDPSLFKTGKFEVAIHRCKKGNKSDGHYHKKAREINIIITGKAKIKNLILTDNHIFVYYPNEKTHVEFLEDTTLVVIKFPSLSDDKYV